MTQFMPMPEILTQNNEIGIDYWVICDESDCYLFFTALNGKLYRARTAKTSFPSGFEGSVEIVIEESQFALMTGCAVYQMAGTNQYLLLVEAFNGVGDYYRAWTADRLDGTWSPLAATESDAFASLGNLSGADWPMNGIFQGELLRASSDETMTIDTCNLQFLFTGRVDDNSDSYDHYSIGMLTAE